MPERIVTGHFCHSRSQSRGIGTAPSDAGAGQTTEALVEGGAGAQDLEPVGVGEAAGVEQREKAQQREVQGAEEGVRQVRQEGRAEQHEDGVQRRGADNGEDEGYERRLSSQAKEKGGISYGTS